MNALKAGMLATLLGLVPAAAVQATPNIANVYVTAPTHSGGLVLCFGEACASVLQRLQNISFNEIETGMLQDFAPISYEEFCRDLKQRRPAGCNRAAPPSVPFFNSAWRGNGCGRGGLERVLLTGLVRRVYADFSGDFDAPYQGVSFLDACNAHDRCWATAGERNLCDAEFRRDMMSACGDNNRCETYASAYHAAVGTNSATSTYNASVAAFACASWAWDINMNGCPA